MTEPQDVAGLVELMARAVRKRRFERTRRGASYDETVPPTENELDEAAAALASLSEQPAGAGKPITLAYTNWRGETAPRTILPQRLWFGSTQWHPEPQWLIQAQDVVTGEDRDFALTGFAAPPASLPAGVPTQAQMNQAFYVDVCQAEDRLREFVEASRKLLNTLPPHWHGEAESELRDLADETNAVLNPHMHTPYQVEQATKRYGRAALAASPTPKGEANPSEIANLIQLRILALSEDKSSAKKDFAIEELRFILKRLATHPAASEAPTELPDDLREPIHSLQADLDWLVARIRTEDDDVVAMLKDSIRTRLSHIEEASYRYKPPAASLADALALVNRPNGHEQIAQLTEAGRAALAQAEKDRTP